MPDGPPRVALLTREYPPDVYGGAGVHVEYLARELDRLVDLTVHCFGEPRPDGERPPVVAHTPWEQLAGPEPYRAALSAVSVDLAMAAALADADLVHSHTWYANLAGHLAKLVHGVPHVATVHSLEPLRPWKAEQLGGGYALSSWCERVALEAADAVVAVSAEHRRDLLACYPAIDPERVTVIGNGIDTTEYRPDHGTDVLGRNGIDPERPIVLFVGRITRQKGLAHLLDAAPLLDSGAQLVLCAGAADTPELAAEIEGRIRELEHTRSGVVWIERMLCEAGGDPAPHARDRVRLPIDLRAARDRQPRGDGMRDGGRGNRDRRHPGGGRGRRHGPARAVRPGRRPGPHAPRPCPVRPRDRRAGEPTSRQP